VHFGRSLAGAFLLLLHDALAAAAALLQLAAAALALSLKAADGRHLGGDGLDDRRGRRRRRLHLAADSGGGERCACGGHGAAGAERESLVHGAVSERLVARPRQRQHRGGPGARRADARRARSAARNWRDDTRPMPAWQ
jgi:hypothetical protein